MQDDSPAAAQVHVHSVEHRDSEGKRPVKLGRSAGAVAGSSDGHSPGVCV
jgi:hypothetical protein